MTSIFYLLLLLTNGQINEQYAAKIDQAVIRHCQFPKLTVYIMWKESRFKHVVINENSNNTTDLGLMQINSVHGEVPMTIDENIRLGCELLESHYDPTDRKWWARYHSKTKALRDRYYRAIIEEVK